MWVWLKKNWKENICVYIHAVVAVVIVTFKLYKIQSIQSCWG